MSSTRIAKVLVVDDEPHCRQLLIDALSAADMQISAAASGAEALELASRQRIDFIVTDLQLTDGTGLDVLDELSERNQDIPSVIITGHGDRETFSEASRRHPVELMNKPLDLDRLREIIRRELARRRYCRRWRRRTQRIRRIAHKINRQRKFADHKLKTTCAELTDAYRALSEQMSFQEVMLGYQHEMIAAANDDDVFRSMFRAFVRRTGPLFGVSLACNSEAELRIVGRFGVPQPDGIRFCEMLTWPIVEAAMVDPQCMVMDLTEERDMFDESIRKYLAGVTVLTVPLIPSAGEMSGLAIFYRKGEQPFTDEDVAMAEAISVPTAVAILRND